MRQLILLVALFICIGCRTQSWNPLCGPGTRVPPPATGSYGQANTYYQGSLQPIPNNLTDATGETSSPGNRWTTVRDERSSTLTADSSSGRSSSVANSSSTVDIDVALTQPRLKGMPVNRVRPTAEPGRFVPDSSASALKSPGNSEAVGSGVRVAGATASDASTSREVNPANWQSRANTLR